MDFFFKPQGIAVVGATPNPMKGGHAILKNLVIGYRGAIFPVNPGYQKIGDLACYPSVQSIPDRIDLAIIFIPAPHVPAAVRDCAAKGVRGVIIESGGFAETGSQGAMLQEELTAIAHRTGMRIWGPNCMGLVDAVNSHIFSFMSEQAQLHGFIPGTVSLVVQSGMLSAIFLIDLMSNATMGISKVCSIGNKVDVNENDLLEYLADDPETRVTGLYLESFVDGRRFLDICRRCEKPIVVLKGGRSGRGAEAAMSHTASLAGNRRIVAGALAQAGVVEANDFKQMMDLCRSLALTKPPKGGKRRIAVLTFSGGAGIVSTDFVEENGLVVADLAESTRNELKTLFPEWMPVGNPVDLWPAIETHIGDGIDVYSRALAIVLADPGVDAVFFHVAIGNALVPLSPRTLSARIIESGKPVIVWQLGRRDEVFAFQKEALELGIPVFSELARATECLKAALREPRRPEPVPKAEDPKKMVPQEFADVLSSSGSGPLDEHLSKEILHAFGLPTVREKIVTGSDQVEAVCAFLGYPVVMKGLLPGGVHKTEMGLVRMDIQDGPSALRTYGELMALMKGEGRVLIQSQIRGNVELILGMLRDPQFGPCVMFGLGGVAAEIFDDAVFATAPLTHKEAIALIGRIKGQKLLDGFRGAPSVNREEIARSLVALGEIGTAFPQISEIDINPMICGTEGPVAVDAIVIV